MDINFIPLSFYGDVYLIIVSVLSLFCFLSYSQRDDQLYLNIPTDRIKAFVVFVIFALYIGCRPISGFFGDMPEFMGVYNSWEGPFEFRWDAENLIYSNQMDWFASQGIEPRLYYVWISIIYFGCMCWACCKMFPGNAYATLLVCLGAFSTYAAGVNGFKAGSAGAVFLVGLAYWDNWKVWIPMVLISWGLHHSMHLPLICFLMAMVLYKKPKWFFYFWIFCGIFSIFHITYFQDLFAGITDQKGASYLTDGDRLGADLVYDKGGFRWDFIIYSAMPVLMGWYAITKKGIWDKGYIIILCTYILSNSIWMLCMYALFSNRIAYLSWFMYPIVLIYPLFLEQWGPTRYKTFAKIGAAHLGFTLFMSYIY